MNFSTPLEEIHKVYGDNAIVSQVNGYNIIHLDDPTDNQIKERIQDVRYNGVDPVSGSNCPLCQILIGKPCDIVYYPKL